MEKHEHVSHLVDMIEFLTKELDLHPDHAKLLRLAFYGDKTWEDLSVATGVKPVTVKYKFKLAFSILKARVEGRREIIREREQELELLRAALRDVPIEHKKKHLNLVPIEELGFSSHTSKLLKDTGIDTLADLVSFSTKNLAKLSSFKAGIIQEIEEYLAKNELRSHANS